MAAAFEARKDEILAANKIDLDKAKGTDMSTAMLKRLELTEKKIALMADGVRQIAALRDPVGETIEGTPAAETLQEGDRILTIAGSPVESWNDISVIVNDLPEGESFTLTVLRDGAEQELSFTPYYDEETTSWKLGIYPMQERQKLTRAIGLGFKQTYLFTKELILAIVGMFRGEVPVDVGGPVAIVSVISDATSYGIQSLLLLTAYLCINLGLVNLLPLPALDGSRLVFLAVEGLRGKPIDRRKEGLVHLIGLMLLLGLMLLITYHDIVNLVGGKL